MSVPGIVTVFKTAAVQWVDDKAPRLGAALAYYGIFSVAPLLIVSISVAGFFLGERAARGQIVHEVEGVVGRTGGEAIQEMLKSAKTSTAGPLATAVGVIVLLVGASGVFAQLLDALNTIWKVTPKPGRGWVRFLRDRLTSFLMVLLTAVLLLASLVATTAVHALSRSVPPDWLGGRVVIWQLTNSGVSLVVFTLLFAAVFRLLPDVDLSWGDVWLGAAVTAVLFTLGKYLIGVYLTRAGVASAYGALGSIVALLVWIYYTAQIVLFGAEFTRAHTLLRGERVAPTPNAVALTKDDLARQGMPRAE